MIKSQSTKPLVSVVIPTTPREIKVCELAVKYVNDSTYKNVEILVINKGLERSKQRNIGLLKAKGEFILLLDSDQLINPDLIAECLQRMKQQKDIVGIYIPEKIVTVGFFGYLRNWERQFYTGTCVDVVRFVRNKNIPMFDYTMSGPEDSDWDRRIEGRRCISQNYLWHCDGMSLKKYLKKKAYYTKSMARYKEKWPDDKVLNFWYRCFVIYFEQGKWKRVLKRPDLYICLMGLVFLRGVIYVSKR